MKKQRLMLARLLAAMDAQRRDLAGGPTDG